MLKFQFNLQNHSEVETTDTAATSTIADTTATEIVNDAVNTIVSAETSNATDAVQAAAVAAINSAVSPTSNVSVISDLILKANAKITELQSEEDGTSKSWYVKDIRDPFEVIVIKALVVAVTSGSAVALAELTKKLQ
jgi:hypothetical protein